MYKEDIPVNDNNRRLDLSFFLDDFNPANAYGNMSILAVYLVVENVKLQYQMKRNDIMLVLLAKADLTLNRYRDIFTPLRHDLQRIQNDGLEVKLDNNIIVNITIRICHICGDNKGLHKFFGLPGNFNCNYICRFCLIQYTELQNTNHTFLNAIPMRTTDTYIVSQYSIQRRHPFYDSNHQLINDINSVQTLDILHDFYQGIIPVISHKIIFHMIRARRHGLKLIDIINRKNEIRYKNGAVRLGNEKIYGSAIQKREFFLKFPLIFYNEWTPMNTCFLVYTNLMSIICIVESEFITNQMITRLEQLIIEFYDLLGLLGLNIIPKMHYIRHMPLFIRRHGNPIQYSTWRFERKHFPLSQRIKRCKCYRNITKTVSDRHQEMMSLIDYPSNIIRDFAATNARNICYTEIDETIKTLISTELTYDCETLNSMNILDVKALTYKGLEFKQHFYYIIDKNDVGMPVFAYISNIFIFENNIPIIIAGRFTPNVFNQRLHAYSVNTLAETNIILSVRSLLSSKAFSNFVFEDNEYILKTFQISKRIKYRRLADNKIINLLFDG